MDLWKINFKRNFNPIWEILTDKQVKDKEDAINLIKRGIMKNKIPPTLSDRYRWLKEALWRVNIGVPNSIEITLFYHGREETIKVTSYRQNYIKSARRN